jgi:galactitol-specific phosphotransferase system IIB component
MAMSQVDINNKLIVFTEDINREFVRQNMFSPYMGEGLNAVIRLRNELKAGGEDMNIPIVTRLRGAGVATSTLVGNEEKIDNYGMRLRMEWARNAIAMTKAEQHKDSADMFAIAKPLLTDWGKELQRDEIIAALMALPTETLPTSSGGVRVNGIQYDLATAAQRNTWNVDNQDRILYGAATSNWVSVHATALGNVDTTADKFTATNLSLMKRMAMSADPRIRPYTTDDGYEHFIVCAGVNAFRDLKISLETINKDARPRENRGVERNPIFQDGDQLYDGCIVRCVPEISSFVGSTGNPGPWGVPGGGNLLLAGAASARVEPVFLLGQQAVVIGWGQMAKPTFRKEDDYGFINGVGIEMAYGIAKMFKRHPNLTPGVGPLKQWGVVTGFFASASD